MVIIIFNLLLLLFLDCTSLWYRCTISYCLESYRHMCLTTSIYSTYKSTIYYHSATHSTASIQQANNTFVSVVMTDYRQSYAVYEYQCGDINWGDHAIIGYKAGRQRFEQLGISGRSATQVDCLHDTTSVVFYNLTCATPRGTCIYLIHVYWSTLQYM